MRVTIWLKNLVTPFVQHFLPKTVTLGAYVKAIIKEEGSVRKAVSTEHRGKDINEIIAFPISELLPNRFIRQ